MVTTKTVARELARIVEPAMAELQVPGVVVGISRDGVDEVFPYGVTNVEFPLPVDAETLFLIGSTTKTFTGTVLMRLVEEGKVALDAPVTEYLPKFRVSDPEVARSVTVHHLVTHTSGWTGDYFSDLGRGDDATARIVASMAKNAPQLTPLGSVWSYNNAGFYVLGRIIEVVTRRTYEEVVSEWILEPLGMRETFFFAEEVMTHKHALGHSRGSAGPAVARPWGMSRASAAAGGIASTAPDQLRYARFHMGRLDLERGVRPPITPESVHLMREPRAEAGSMADQVGVTWLIERIGRHRVIGHGGSINGQMSAFKMVPAQGLAVTVLTNGQLGAQLGARVTDWVLATLGGIRRPAPPARRLSEKAAAQYVGRYRGDPGHLVVRFEDGGLVVSTELRQEVLAANPELPLQLPPPTRFLPRGNDVFVAADPKAATRRIEFVRDDRGEVAWLRFGGRVRPVWRPR